MLMYFIPAIFLICCAIAAGTIFMLTKLRKQYAFAFLSALLFLLVFHFMFGFYSLWGQFIIAYLVKPYISNEIFTRITDLSMLLGFPFLVFAWLMLIRFAWEFTGKEMSTVFIFLFLILNSLIISGLIYYLSKNPGIGLLTLLKYYYIFSFFVVSVLAAIKLISQKSKVVSQVSSGKFIAIGLTSSVIVQSAILPFYSGNLILALVFLLVFFSGIGFIPVYLNYFGKLESFIPEKTVPISMDEFCKKFEVSPREREIIIEICNGLSNQQIADKLFISLQTVKDHSHRIYGKVDVSSRVQLIKLVAEINAK
jgi:DNA-binding CsgD family transcriptional regulator